MPLLAATSLETLLIFLAIFLISGLSNWLKRRNQPPEVEPLPDEDEATPRPMPRAPPVTRPNAPPPTLRPQPAQPEPQPAQPLPRRFADWEEELRRLLGEPPLAQPEPPKPPPVVVAERPALPPRPAPPDRATPVPRPAPPHEPFPEVAEEEMVPTSRLAKFVESQSAHAKASQLHESVAARMRRVDTRTGQAVPTVVAIRQTRSADVDELVTKLRSPRTTRQLVMAATILGPPKALDQ
jgi:hypothetical protein